MQTFIPIATTDFQAIAKTLDNKRLNKQALEAWQILMTLWELDPQGNTRIPKGWVNHPAVKMWRGYEIALFLYITEMVTEWQRRGFKSTIAEKAACTVQAAMQKCKPIQLVFPSWINDEQLASTHRLALLTKDYEWYSQFGWPEDTGVAPTEYEYKWPV